ncbi:S-layer homology domain-containing protein [Paenibacillus sepulcri]|uniref:S-layer homology domain-containing protein n=1 Tax=Paenibacillus sepulcri TaxID=359917 RepID=A0ABS7CA83_9BACL|nr:S-layer homology domain-containing protein [Paenibacillus sepulcri]
MVKVEIPASIIEKANEMKIGIVIKTSDAKILIPSGSVDIKDSDSIVRLVASASNSLSSTGGLPLGAKLVTNIYDFTLMIDDKPVTSFGEPVLVTFEYDQNLVQDVNKLGAFYFDEKAKTWTYVGGKINGDGTVSASLPHFSSYAVMEYNKSFEDIGDHWARTEIERLAAKQIITGVTDEKFEPDSPVTRAQFTTLLTKALNLKSNPHDQVFQDVDDNAWYGDVYAAYQAAIVSGMDERHFAPNDWITREQLSVMVMNAYQYASGKQLSDLIVKEGTKYSDETTISNWAREDVRLSSGLGLLTGAGSSAFNPKQTASRAQASVVLYRLFQLVSTY